MISKIDEHIESYNPSVSHYRREHAPNRRYISPDFTVVDYTNDKSKDTEDEVIFSADMQKVIMLPFMQGIKTCAFTRRLVTFHQTFAPLGTQQGKAHPQKVRSVIWHEAIAGRSAADVTSAFRL